MAGIRVSEIRLRYLYEVSQHHSMQAASEKLNVAPSSVSRQISQLEAELGAPLLERGHRKVKLTEIGELAVRYYREHMSHEEAFLSKLQDIRGLCAGTLAVAVGEGFINDSFSLVLQEYCKKNPGIRIEIEIGSTNSIQEMVADDIVHIGVTLDAPTHPKIRVRNVKEHSIYALVAPQHELARHEKIQLGDLVSQQVAMPCLGFRIRQLIREAEQKEGVSLTPQLTSNSILVLKNYALAGSGVTILPKVGLASEIEAGRLCAIPIISDSLLHASSQIVTRLGRQLPAAALAFMRQLELHWMR